MAGEPGTSELPAQPQHTPDRKLPEVTPWTEADADQFKGKLVEIGIINDDSQPIQHLVPEDATPRETIEGFLKIHGATDYVDSLSKSNLSPDEIHYRMNALYKGAFNEQTRKDFEASFKPAPTPGQ